MIDDLQSIGCVEIIKSYKDGAQDIINVKNSILYAGRRALTNSLANAYGGTYEYYIMQMIFGDGGTTPDGVKRYVNASRNGLFGQTLARKPVLSNIDNSVPTQAIFTSVIRFDELVGVTINEMALEMANGELYSMTTFPDLTKTEDLQLTLNWRINFI